MHKQRLQGLDIFRGMALFLMIIYHFIFDLNYFLIVSINMNENLFFLLLRYAIMGMFVLSVGMSLVLTHQAHINWKNIAKRIIQLGLASLLVSLATYMIFPDSWVYFGILHFILFSSLLVLPLINFPKITLFLALFILVGSSTGILHLHQLFELLQEPLGLPSPHSQDLVPIFPWLAPLFMGMFLVQSNYHQKIFSHPFFKKHTPMHTLLKKMGQNSLLIYLLHQPFLFLGFEFYFKFFSK
ncbi:MAG: Unknown protein [uncultured Sulfurovum sp.]|uniref:Heparan-alpha-glucosaminide N-acetyltransferase catalytic domain-containing protein n=1 Tax=uncultured Sulfurovum sp. TaxID=269237 RepID=A0A6S6TTL2_9BACT|nr:MAG: Unknown protein [uncultured Sulfurovum sp.]